MATFINLPTPQFARGTKKGCAALGYKQYANNGNAFYTLAQAQSVLTNGGFHYWYDYTIPSSGDVLPTGGTYIPMFWDLAGQQYTGAPAFNSTNIGLAVQYAGNGGYIMFLNEAYNGTPGVNAGAVDPTVAATNWDILATDSRVIAANIKLISPVWTDTAGAETWFATFWNAITSRKPDLISVHKYAGTTQNSTQAANGILGALATLRGAYPRFPYVLTEFAMQPQPTDQQQQDFLATLLPLLEEEYWLQFYNFFWCGPATITGLGGLTDHLYNDNATATVVGTSYASYP